MKFTREFLQQDLYDSKTTVLDEITDQSRWSTHHHRVFRFEGLFYETYYSRGSTETQDESPYEYSDEEIECPEVIATEKTITVYVAKQEAQ